MSKFRNLNIRDLGGIPMPDSKGTMPNGLFIRSGKLSILTEEECAELCRRYNVKCVIDLRTPVESAEFLDPLPKDVDYLQIPLLKDAAIGITHETGSDPMTIIRNIRKHPEKLKEMIPDLKSLYTDIVTDDYSRAQLDKVITIIKKNVVDGKCTLYHCTAGKDRTGIVSMALLKSYGISDDEIVKDYMRTNRNAFWPTMKKCLGIGLMTWNWSLVKTAYKAFMADEKLIRIAIEKYTLPSTLSLAAQTTAATGG